MADGIRARPCSPSMKGGERSNHHGLLRWLNPVEDPPIGVPGTCGPVSRMSFWGR